MSLKSKIIAKIKEKVKSEGGYNLSNVRINGLAEKIDARVDNEDAIDGEIDTLNELFPFKEMAALDDAKRNAEKKKAEEEDKNDPEPKPAPVDPKPSDKDETPNWMKVYIEKQDQQMTAIQHELSSIKAGNVSKSRRSQLEEKLKDAPEKFKARALRDFDRIKIDSDEDFTDYLADIEQDVADEIQAEADSGAGNDRPMGGVENSGGKVKEATDKELDAVMENFKI